MNENNACFGVTCLLPRGNEGAQEVLRSRRRERQSSLPRFVIVRDMTTMFTQSRISYEVNADLPNHHSLIRYFLIS
jgi:hypothetical protein